MLGILLLLLKIIGWLLLGIVCLVLALLLLVLFVPVPYRFQAQFGDEIWYRLRVFGIQVFPPKEKPEGRKRRKKRKKGADGEAAGQETAEKELPDKKAADSDGEATTDSGKSADSETVTSADSKTPADGEAATDGAGADAGEQPDEPPGTGLSDSEKPPNAKEALPEPDDSGASKKKARGRKGPGGKKSRKGARGGKKGEKKHGEKGVDLDALREKWALVRGELADEGNHRALSHGLSEVIYILRHYGPRRVEADVIYSLGDPANTGYVTAALSVCPFVYGKRCDIVPDFTSEKLYAKGRVDVRGHVRLVHCGMSGVRLIIDRDIRAVIKKIRRKK